MKRIKYKHLYVYKCLEYDLVARELSEYKKIYGDLLLKDRSLQSLSITLNQTFNKWDFTHHKYEQPYFHKHHLNLVKYLNRKKNKSTKIPFTYKKSKKEK